jgi:hypothetical protein
VPVVVRVAGVAVGCREVARELPRLKFAPRHVLVPCALAALPAKRPRCTSFFRGRSSSWRSPIAPDRCCG